MENECLELFAPESGIVDAVLLLPGLLVWVVTLRLHRVRILWDGRYLSKNQVHFYFCYFHENEIQKCHLIDRVLPVQPALDPPAARRRVDHRRVGAAARARLGGSRRGRLPPRRCSFITPHQTKKHFEKIERHYQSSSSSTPLWASSPSTAPTSPTCFHPRTLYAFASAVVAVSSQ